MNEQQKRNWRNFRDRARRRGWEVQKSYHGCGKWSAQAFDATGKCVSDWNL